MDSFILGVRAHPCLWNPTHPDYREIQVRDAAWRRIVKECNSDFVPNVKTARAEWKRLRDNHRQALRRAKLGQNKLLPAQITTWKYAKTMQFLEPHMSYRITENIEMDGEATKSVEDDMTETETVDHNDIKQNTNKRKCEDCSPDNSTISQHADALESFFNCMLKSTSHMPQWMQTSVKKKIFAVIIEAEESLSLQQMKFSEEVIEFPKDKKIKIEVPSSD